MKTSLRSIITSGAALLIIFLAAPVRGDILYAANAAYSQPFGPNYILKFTSGGSGSIFGTGVSTPLGLAFNRAGNLFVVNNGSSTIMAFTPGGVGSVFASSGLSGPEGLAFDSAGNLYVVNIGNGTIEEFTPGGAGSLFASPVIMNSGPTFLAFTDDAGVPLPLANQVPEPSA